MPVLDLSDEELQGFVVLCATASGPGINWTLTNALLNKARLAQERSQANLQAQGALAPHQPIDLGPLGGEVKLGNSEDKANAAVPRA